MTSTNTPPGTNTANALQRFASFDQIDVPGAYVSSNGMLARVDEQSLKPQHSPTINLVTNSAKEWVRVSDNPNTPIGKLRQLAANADLAVDF